MGNKRPGEVLIFTKHAVLDAEGKVIVRDAEVKGDVAGHDFHGNRYTGGIGGSIHDAQERFKALKAQWAITNNDLLKLVNTPMSPEAVAKLAELRAINVEMAQLQADPGGPQGMGFPGGARDVVIIGAGPGGLSAAINAKADGLDTLVVDGAGHPGGQSAFSSRIENYPGFPAGVTGAQLASSMYDQATRLGADTQFGVRVTGITQDPATGMKTVALSDGTTVDARTVILAGGVTQRTLDFPGADSSSVIYGDGAKVAQMCVGGEAVIIGGSNGAAQAALGAAESADHVTVFARTDLSGMSDYQIEALKSNPKIDVIQHEEVASYDEATGQVFAKDGYALSDVKAIGVFAGGPPDTSWLPSDIQLVKGSVAVNGDLQTSMPGVFAVGDVRDGAPHRVLGAAADGQVAEKNVWNYLDAQRQKKSAPARGSATGMVAFIDKMYHLDVASPYSLQIGEGESDRKAARLAELKAQILAEMKGDVAHHPFHGNRFTGGIGGIDGPPNVGHFGDAVHQAIVSHKITNEPEAYGYLNSPAAAALTVDERERLLQQARSYASLREYQGNESGITNGYLRGEVTKDAYPNADKEFWQGLQDRVANIDAAMSPSPTDRTVYRAMGELGAEKLLGTEDNTANMQAADLEAKLNQLAGSSIVDNGYVSTSLDKEVAGAKTNMVPILFEINEPKGTPEVSFPDHPGLGDDARYAYEKEVLLEHGQRYRIDGWRVAPATEFGTQYPTHIIHLTAAGPAATAKAAEKPTVTEHDRFVWDDGFDIIPA